MLERFAKLARAVSSAVGSPYAFGLAALLVIGWAATGPFFGWSDSHSLFINTITTCITFLVVFLIQGAQNRDTAALNAKVDELICASEHASNKLIAIEEDTDQHLAEARRRSAEAKG